MKSNVTTKAATPAIPTAKYRVEKPLFVKVRMLPPKKGALVLPTAVAEFKIEIRSPLFVGNRSAMAASVTGTKIAVANP